MATTYFDGYTVAKGKTILQTLAERFGYGQRDDKTRDGELVTAYECDPKTASAEFLLNKAKYKALTGRQRRADDDILYYLMGQSFARGEITPEDANRLGYEFATRWTKGKHAFFVCTHVDTQTIHNHIYYDAIALDHTRKFRDFKGSYRAVRRLSDRICLEWGLSYIRNPKKHSEGKYKHYGEWLGNRKPPTFQQQLVAQIDACLAQRPANLEDFLQAMQAAGWEVKQRGGSISFRANGQDRFTRLRAATLGAGYSPKGIRAYIEERGPKPQRRKGKVTGAKATAGERVNLLVDIQARMRGDKGPGYERWAKLFNLKQMAHTLQYLQENDLLQYEALEQRAATATDRFHDLAATIRQAEGQLAHNAELQTAIVDYAKTRPVFDGYRAAQYSRKYLGEHEDDIQLYREAQATFKRLLDGGKLPKMQTLRANSKRLEADKSAAYREYWAAQKDMREVLAAKANIDGLLGVTTPRQEKEQER